jgi:GGDEF domain-containing protein
VFGIQRLHVEKRGAKGSLSTSFGGSSAEEKRMQELGIVMERDPKTIPAPQKRGKLPVDFDKAIQKLLSRIVSFMGQDVTFGPRQGSTIGTDTLKNLGIELPEPLKKPYKGPERRKDFHKRKRVEEMTPEEMREELLIDPLTGLGNKRAYQEDPRLPVQVFVDVDSLKWINDNICHEAGDELLKTVGWALDSLDCPGYRSYHISGDEFIIQARSVQIAQAAIKHALLCLDKVTFEYTLPDGTAIRKKGAGISYGIATTVERAEEKLRKHKVEREAKGLRAARGETPPGVARGEVSAVWTSLQWARSRDDRPSGRTYSQGIS